MIKIEIGTLLKKVGAFLLDILYPRRCPACDEIVTPLGEKIHAGCIRKLKLQTPPWCIKCGKKLLMENDICDDCREANHVFIRGRSLYSYKEIAESIYRFKYSGRQEYAEYYAEEIVKYLGDFIKSVKPDALVPVPLHRKRLAKRGYNQASVLSKQISKLIKIPTNDHFVIRKKNTKALKILAPSERQKNLQNAFIVRQNSVKLNTIIIIDDIYTTGATIDEIGRTLLRAGAKDVYFVTLASGQGI